MARTDVPTDGRSGVATLLWAVAYSAEAIAAFAVPADVAGVSSLMLLGHAVTAAVLLVDVVNRRLARRNDDAGFLSVVLLVFAAAELGALVVATREGEAGQAMWFAAAVGFAVAGMLAVWRGGGSDGVIAAQLALHGVLMIPAIGAAVTSLFMGRGNGGAAGVVAQAGPVARRLFVVGGIALPPLFVTILAVLAHDRSRAAERAPSPVWTALLVHEAAHVVLAARWAYDGI